MHENFITLEQEKRDRIMNAAMSEFSLKGFKNASTNEIVKKAGISKGALFHYFSSKQEMFEFLYSYHAKIFTDIFYPMLDDLPKDVMKRWSTFAAMKMEMVTQYPLIFEFMLAAGKDEDSGVQEFLNGVKVDFTKEFMSKIYEGIDYTKFKESIDIQRALEIIWWTLEGFASKMQRTSTIDNIKNKSYVSQRIAEMNGYLSMLKQTFYKEEYLGD